MPGEVAHALEVGAHSHRRHDHAQVGGDGLLAGEQVDRGVVELTTHLVDGLVRLDHGLGELEVGVEEGDGRPAHRRAGEAGHLDELVRDLVELLVERVAHGFLSLRCRGVGAVAVGCPTRS